MLTLALRSRDSGSSEASAILSDKALIPCTLQLSDRRNTLIPCSVSVGRTSSTASCSSANTERLSAPHTMCHRVSCCAILHMPACIVLPGPAGIGEHMVGSSVLYACTVLRHRSAIIRGLKCLFLFAALNSTQHVKYLLSTFGNLFKDKHHSTVWVCYLISDLQTFIRSPQSWQRYTAACAHQSFICDNH